VALIQRRVVQVRCLFFPCRKYTRIVKVGKLTTVGDSVGVVVPRQYREQLGWFKGDQIMQAVVGNTIVLSNVTQHFARPVLHRGGYGNGKSKRG
jgi:bifunctional DNA-binding transcriptional regulator/antitoxin component of YhaV-PrlF toxin-antitoxin module